MSDSTTTTVDEATATMTIASEVMTQANTRIAELEAALAEREAALEAATAKHERFKVRVRETAKKVSEEQSWCRPGMNRVLTQDLELEPYQSEWRVTVRVHAYQDVTVTLTADDDDDAWEKATEDSSRLMDAVNVHRWIFDEAETQSTDEV